MEFSFRGHSDFLVHSNDVGASQILVATGEVQSTKSPVLQNGIYAVGHLLNNLHLNVTKICCITLFKNKSVMLSLAKQDRCEEENEGMIGRVSFKHVLGTNAMDLTVEAGIEMFAARLKYVLTEML